MSLISSKDPAQPKPGDRIRYRIAEIALQPPTSKRKIKVELFVDGKAIRELPLIRDSQQLKWDKLFVFDARRESRLQLVVHERNNRIYSDHPSNTCVLSEIANSSTPSIDFASFPYIAVVRFFGQAEAEERFKDGLEKMNQMKRTSLLGKMGKAREVFKSMLEIGSIVSELHPAAKIVFSVCTTAWKTLEKEEKCDEDLSDLLESLGEISELVDLIKDSTRTKHLQNAVKALLDLMEDVSIFAMEYRVKGSLARAVYSLFDGTNQEKMEELAKRFQNLKSNLHLSLDAQTAKIVVTANDRNALKQLNPVEPSGYDPSRACLPGTRLDLLRDIHAWIETPDSTSHFLWIYGQAGIGKSSIVSSVCERLDKEGRTPVSFFCKRDDPALRDPLRLINSVVHGLCTRCPPYAKAVVEAIENNWELCTSHLGVRYEGLVQKPLESLRTLWLPHPLVVVIDALDECGTNDSRQQVMRCLRDMCMVVPWLRVCATSRADQDIQAFFDHYQSPVVFRFDVQAYGAAGDIKSFVEARLSTIAITARWPSGSIQKVCEKAGELFIWAATACKYLDSYNSLDRLHQLLEGSQSSSAFGGLDSLYSTVIRNCALDDEEDSKALVRRCIGVIVATSRRQPLPVQALGELLRAHVPSHSIEIIVARLGAILYLDKNLGGAVRVYHPSFADYAQDKARSHDLCANLTQINTELATGCLAIMKQELCFNICRLETSYLLNSEVFDLDTRVQNNISQHLSYSCTYWIDHLIESELDILISDVEKHMFEAQFLYWLEVLSLGSKLHVAVSGLSRLVKRIPAEFEGLVDFVQDAYRFVSLFFDPISASTPHIYVSALALSPKQSGIVKRLGNLFPNTVSVTEGDLRAESWPQWLRTFQHPDEVRSLSVSRDGALLATACLDGAVRVWDLATGELVTQSTPTLRAWRVRIFPDGTRITSLSEDDNICIWNYTTGEVEFLGTIFVGHTKRVTCAEISLDARLVVSGSDDTTVRIWDTNSGEAVGYPCSGHYDSVTEVAFSPDSTLVVSVS